MDLNMSFFNGILTRKSHRGLDTASTVHLEIDACDEGSFVTGEIAAGIGHVFGLRGPAKRHSLDKRCQVLGGPRLADKQVRPHMVRPC